MAGIDTSKAQITESRLQEALNVRDRMIIELLVQVLDEQLVIERPILRERLSNLIKLIEVCMKMFLTFHYRKC